MTWRWPAHCGPRWKLFIAAAVTEIALLHHRGYLCHRVRSDSAWNSNAATCETVLWYCLILSTGKGKARSWDLIQPLGADQAVASSEDGKSGLFKYFASSFGVSRCWNDWRSPLLRIRSYQFPSVRTGVGQKFGMPRLMPGVLPNFCLPGSFHFVCVCVYPSVLLKETDVCDEDFCAVNVMIYVFALLWRSQSTIVKISSSYWSHTCGLTLVQQEEYCSVYF